MYVDVDEKKSKFPAGDFSKKINLEQLSVQIF